MSPENQARKTFTCPDGKRWRVTAGGGVECDTAGEWRTIKPTRAANRELRDWLYSNGLTFGDCVSGDFEGLPGAEQVATGDWIVARDVADKADLARRAFDDESWVGLVAAQKALGGADEGTVGMLMRWLGFRADMLLPAQVKGFAR